MQIINPATEELIQEMREDDAEISCEIRCTENAQNEWLSLEYHGVLRSRKILLSWRRRWNHLLPYSIRSW